MVPKEIKNVKGRVKVVVRDARTGEVLKVIEKENVITDAGKAFAADAYANFVLTRSRAWYIDIGTGICDPTPQDQDLCSPIIESVTINTGTEENPNWVTYYIRRWAKQADVTVQNNTVIFHARWMPEDANGYSICEEILFAATPARVTYLYTPRAWLSPDPLKNITQSADAIVAQHASFSCVSKTPSILLDIYVTITFT